MAAGVEAAAGLVDSALLAATIGEDEVAATGVVLASTDVATADEEAVATAEAVVVAATDPPVETPHEYEATLKTASEPVKGSLPAPMDKRYWLSAMPSLSTRYDKKSYRSPSKSATALLATKLNTCVSPLYPSYKSQVVPAMVGVATVLPVEEMGPAPPRASSQTMISYSSLPVAEDEVNMSYETSATRSVPA